MKKILTHCLGLILLYFPLPLSSAQQKVLIIESYHSDHPWDQSYIQGIKSVLKDDFELLYFQMNTKRLPKTAYHDRADKAWLHFQTTQPDLVILGDDNALKYLGRRFSKTVTPVIFLGINNNPRHYQIHHSKNITGILERPLIKRAIPIMAQLLAQKVTHILLMFDNSLSANAILEEVFSGNSQRIISGIKVDIRLIGEWENWQSTVLTASDKYDAVFFGLYHTLTDKNSNHIAAEQVLQWSVKNSSLPPFAFWDFSIGQDKAIGGLVHFGFEQGKLAAKMTKEILEMGVEPYQISTKTAEKGSYLFSRKALLKYNLTLPEDIALKTTFVD